MTDRDDAAGLMRQAGVEIQNHLMGPWSDVKSVSDRLENRRAGLLARRDRLAGTDPKRLEFERAATAYGEAARMIRGED